MEAEEMLEWATGNRLLSMVSHHTRCKAMTRENLGFTCFFVLTEFFRPDWSCSSTLVEDLKEDLKEDDKEDLKEKLKGRSSSTCTHVVCSLFA